MITFCRVHKLDAIGRDVGVGLLYVHDGQLACYPVENQALQALMDEEVARVPYAVDKPHFVDKTEPELFLKSLHQVRQGVGLRVGPVERRNGSITFKDGFKPQ